MKLGVESGREIDMGGDIGRVEKEEWAHLIKTIIYSFDSQFIKQNENTVNFKRKSFDLKKYVISLGKIKQVKKQNTIASHSYMASNASNQWNRKETSDFHRP